MANRTREEHLQWCKDRALQYVDSGDLFQAFTSMCSDLTKHDETKDHCGIEMGLLSQLAKCDRNPDQMRDWILGFN